MPDIAITISLKAENDLNNLLSDTILYVSSVIDVIPDIVRILSSIDWISFQNLSLAAYRYDNVSISSSVSINFKFNM